MLDDPQAASAADFTRMLDGVDFTSLLGRETAQTAEEMATLSAEIAPARDAELQVHISADGMTAEATLTPPTGDGRPMGVDDLLATLKAKYNITRGIDHIALDRLVDSGRTATTRAVIARGNPPVPGRAETWELTLPTARAVPTAGAHQGGIEAASGASVGASANARIDYRELGAQKAVAIGEILARRIPAEPGTPGTSVSGELIQPPSPQNGQTLRAGSGAERRDDGIYATLGGEMRLDGGTISVIPLRRIDGDVDFSTGNIDFPGNVFIKGSVQDGFSVRAAGDIEVGGSIACAQVVAQGSVHVGGGIVGHEKGKVSSGRGITAKFIENSRVEAREDVIVRKGILNSRVDTLGRVEVMGEPGVVAGGMIRTGTGLRCRTLGAIAETQTHVSFGENYLVYRKLEVIDKAVAFLRDRVRELEMSLTPFKASGDGKLAVEDGAILKKLLALRTKLLGDLRRLMTSRVTVLAEADQAPEGDVCVRGEIHAGVTFSTHGIDRRIVEKHVHARFRLAVDRIEVCPYE